MTTNNTKSLSEMAQEKNILRISSTGIDGRYNTTPELAQQILTTYWERIDETDFPEDQMWRILLDRPSYLCLFMDETSKVPQRIESIVRQQIGSIFNDVNTNKVLLNCNQDVLLILQSPSQDASYSWEKFSPEDLSRLQSQDTYPIAINNSLTNIPLFLASVTEDTIRMSLDTGNLTLWSKSRNELWIKWDTSGDYLRLRQLMWDPTKKVFFAQVLPETWWVCHEKVDAEGNLDKNGTAASTCFRRGIFERKPTASLLQWWSENNK